ncbi:hypothetical protein RFI_27273 [Reticulomyxa filosa]|uniref:Uncharacterized protein n=1 Tax=Reticulomyxa filosa TaxID=46433 RepID=X6M7Z5_RETFI|nr:hypothetical protein RFI_27273 [Reticulomyxa filosa]|eukprot:ETO10103.1 hypothetical protein RFI_27273 [Reticulomyxa filosa]
MAAINVTIFQQILLFFFFHKYEKCLHGAFFFCEWLCDLQLSTRSLVQWRYLRKAAYVGKCLIGTIVGVEVWRNVEFSPKRLTNFELAAKDVIDLGPSSYRPPTGVTEEINYPTNHINESPPPPVDPKNILELNNNLDVPKASDSGSKKGKKPPADDYGKYYQTMKPAQWSTIPFWHHNVSKPNSLFVPLPRIKPLLYKDGKLRGRG